MELIMYLQFIAVAVNLAGQLKNRGESSEGDLKNGDKGRRFLEHLIVYGILDLMQQLKSGRRQVQRKIVLEKDPLS